MMDTTNVCLKDWHRRFAGERFSLFEQFCLENGTTSFEALVTAAALRPQQTVLELGLRRRPPAAIPPAVRGALHRRGFLRRVPRGGTPTVWRHRGGVRGSRGRADAAA